MKLTSLKVKNFRTIGKGKSDDGVTISKMDVNNIICLIGVNNSGKSTVLHAYDFFTNNLEANDDDFHGADKSIPIEITATFSRESEEQIEDTDIKYFVSKDGQIAVKKIWQETTPELEIWNHHSNRWQQPKAPKDKKKWLEYVEKLMPKPVWIQGLSRPDEVIQEIQSVVRQTVFETIKKSPEYADMVVAVESFQKLVKGDSYTGELKQRLTSTIQDIFPDISVDIHNQSADVDTIVKSFEKQTIVRAQEKHGPQVGLAYHGHGVQRQFVLSAYKNCADALQKARSRKKKSPEDFRFDAVDATDNTPVKTKLLLIEEPELFLHPQAIRTVQNLLYDLADNSEYQILCATHSPIMVDLSRDHSSLVRLVPDIQAGTLAYQVDSSLFEDDEKSWLRMLKEFNAHVNESFFASHVFLVEGATEELVLKTILNRLSHSENCYEDVFIVNCNGKLTIPLFQKVLCFFEIPYVVFHDLDYQFDKNGKELNTWKVNKKIWDEICAAAAKGLKCRRFVFNPGFENEHGYNPPSNDKPYVAFEQVNQWLKLWDSSQVQSKPIIRYIKSALDVSGCEHFEHSFDQEWVKSCSPGAAPEDYLDIPHEQQLKFAF